MAIKRFVPPPAPDEKRVGGADRRRPQLLKLEWWSEERAFRQLKNADIDGIVSEAEIDDALEIAAKPKLVSNHASDDEMMVDAMAQEEEAELEALISSLSQQQPQPSRQTQTDDDDDFDEEFMDFDVDPGRHRCQMDTS